MAERVLVGNQDTVEIRYPTPSTWNTLVEVIVRIGTSDIDTVVFGTRIPESKTAEIDGTLRYQRARVGPTNPNYIFTFERDTFYYSDEFTITDIELKVPIILSVETNGPKNLTTNTAECGYSVNGQSFINIQDSKKSFTGNVVKDSKIITNVSSTAGLFVGMSISGNANISGMITEINSVAKTVTLTNLARSSATATSLTAYNTVEKGDRIRLRIKTEDWYTTSTKVTCQIADETWGTDIGEDPTTTIGTWSLTTRAQKLAIPQFNFIDYIDVLAADFSGYKTFNVPITELSATAQNGVDSDCILRASVIDDGEISKNNGVTWITPANDPLTQLLPGNTLRCRCKVGSTYTTKTSTEVDVFSISGEKISTGYPNNPENNITGTWGYDKTVAGVLQSSKITQNMASVSDDWYMWTEVDRYPDPISLSPIYIISDGDEVTVSSTNVYNFAEPTLEDIGQIPTPPVFEYRCDFNISGLGTEYVAGAYDEINTSNQYINATNGTIFQLIDFSTGRINTNTVNGKTVEIEAVVTQGAARIRRQRLVNGSYEYTDWSDRVYVINGDIVNVKYIASSEYNTQTTSTITLIGPPDGSSLGNPTYGPSASQKSFPDKYDTITLKTRQARLKSYPFKFKNIYDADPLNTYDEIIRLSGFDIDTTGFVSSTNNLTQLKAGISAFTNLPITIPAPSNLFSDRLLYGRASSGSDYGNLIVSQVKVGQGTEIYEDQWLIFNKEGSDWSYQSFSGLNTYDEIPVPQFASEIYFVLVGGGGGNGGDDAPYSFGGRGGKGNVLRGYIQLPTEFLFSTQRAIRIYTGKAGADGVSSVSGAAGGSGGWGYAIGGTGGSAGTANSDKSGGGGGGGGASAITFVRDGVETLLAFAGGGGGGGGAGNDTTLQEAFQNANWSVVDQDNTDFGIVKSTIAGLSLTGNNGTNNPGQGGGGGAGGGGYGLGGTIITERRDQSNVVIQTDDLDATGGTGGGAYYNPTYVTLLDDYEYGNFGADSGEDGEIIVYWPPQDRTPIFVGTFQDAEDATPLIAVTSNKIQVTDITGLVDVTVFNRGTSGGRFYVCDENALNCQVVGSVGVVTNNQWIYLEATPGEEYRSTYTVEIQVGTRTVSWNINTGEKPDTRPDNDYDVPDISNVEPSILDVTDPDNPIYTPNKVESELVQILGINTEARIVATGVSAYNVEIAVCDADQICGAWLDPSDNDNPVLIDNGEYFKVRMDASQEYDTTVSTKITVGSDPNGVTYNVKTRLPPDVDPKDFAFLPLLTDPNKRARSLNTVEITGISQPVTFIVDDPSSDAEDNILIELNGTLLETNTVNVTNKDRIRLYYDVPDQLGTSWTFNVSAGDFVTTWFVQTTGNASTTPDTFNFESKAGEAGTFVESEPVQITGISVDVTAALTNGGQIRIANTEAGLASATYLTAVEDFSELPITNGQWIQVRLQTSLIPGLTKTTRVSVGSFATNFSVFSNVGELDVIKGQWYSNIQPMVRNQDGTVVGRFSAKFDGLPIGSMIPVFKDVTTDYNWGDLSGNINSRFHGWIYCDGSYVSNKDYPLLYDVFTKFGLSSEAHYGEQVKSDPGDPNEPTMFRLPDMRNRKLLGTGVVDSDSSSSPIVNPSYNSAGGTGGNIGGTVPGCVGGMWFIDTIGDPGVNGTTDTELEQVYTPAGGQKAQESPYFAIANIRTQGYSNVTDQIQFEVSGYVEGNVSIKAERIYDVPLHTHILITGQPDPGRNKGIVYWGRRGGINTGRLQQTWLNRYPTIPSSTDDRAQTREATAIINIWGYRDRELNMNNNDTIGTPNSGDAVWAHKTEEEPGDPGNNSDSWTEGTKIADDGVLSPVTIEFAAASTISAEVSQYVNVAGFSANQATWFGSVDIPEKEVSVKGFRPEEKALHSHYLSLTQPGSLETTYSYGHSSDYGTASSGAPDTDTVSVRFSVGDTGLDVLPGTFVLSSNKQLIPTPELSPQNKVPLLTPYIWVKWLIKAF